MIVNKLNNCAHLIVNFAKFFISGRPVIESQRRPTLAPQLSFLQKKRNQNKEKCFEAISYFSAGV